MADNLGQDSGPPHPSYTNRHKVLSLVSGLAFARETNTGSADYPGMSSESEQCGTEKETQRPLSTAHPSFAVLCPGPGSNLSTEACDFPSLVSAFSSAVWRQ